MRGRQDKPTRESGQEEVSGGLYDWLAAYDQVDGWRMWGEEGRFSRWRLLSSAGHAALARCKDTANRELPYLWITLETRSGCQSLFRVGLAMPP